MTELATATARLNDLQLTERPIRITKRMVDDTIAQFNGILEHAPLDTRVATVRDLFERVDVDSRELKAVAVGKKGNPAVRVGITLGLVTGPRSRLGLGCVVFVALFASIFVPPTGAPAASAADETPCVATDFVYTMQASVQSTGPWVQSWPGGNATVGTGKCTVTVKQPSARIDLVGTLGDHWEFVAFGRGIGSVTNVVFNKPTCTSEAGLPILQDSRPSCSTAIHEHAPKGPSSASLSFTAVPYPELNLRIRGTGSGTLSATSFWASVACTQSCGTNIPAKFFPFASASVPITVTPSPAPGSVLADFTSVPFFASCDGAVKTCTVTQSSSGTIVIAYFNAVPISGGAPPPTAGGAPPPTDAASPQGPAAPGGSALVLAAGLLATLSSLAFLRRRRKLE